MTRLVPPPLGPPLGPPDFNWARALASPWSAIHYWSEVGRTAQAVVPAALIVATTPFFWAPPLWIGALMAVSRARGAR